MKTKTNCEQPKNNKHIGVKESGFTIVELLVVIVVIGILAAITVTTYNGIQGRARDTSRMVDIGSIAEHIELYKVQTGSYPVTTTNVTTDGSSGATTDSNCGVGTQSINWVPDLVPNYIPTLPQSDGVRPYGPGSGCYKYWSNGEDYIISAWLAVESGPHTGAMYRRVGFGNVAWDTGNNYYCNNLYATGGTNESYDAYKYSFTISNITSCDESAPTYDLAEGCDGEGGQIIYGVCVPRDVLDWITANYPAYHIYRVDDDGGEYEIRIEESNTDDDYRFEYDGDWNLVEIDH